MNGAEQPMTFDAANRWLASRVSVPTEMSSLEISLSKNFRAKVRAHSFFSAKVASANVLDGLRSEADKYARGETDLATTRMNMKLFLLKHGKHGHRPDDVADSDSPPPGVDEAEWKKARSLGNIASTARLDLITRQNARMAHSVGQYEVSMSPDVRERWPFIRYVPSVSRNKRDEHRRFYNLVLPKDHPFWRTNLPPSDFGCKCSWEDVDAEEAEAFGGVDKGVVTDNPDGSQSARLDVNGRPVNVEPNESGYIFDVQEAFAAQDMSRIKSIPLRQAVFRQMLTFTRMNDDVVFRCVPGKLDESVNPVQGDPKAMERHVARQTAKFADGGTFEDKEIKLGVLSPALREAIGIGREGEVFLGKGGSKHGFEHMRRFHDEEILDGRFAKAMKETLFNENTRVTVQLNGGKITCGIRNLDTEAFTTLIKHGQGWSRWNVVSAHYPNYGEIKEVMKK